MTSFRPGLLEMYATLRNTSRTNLARAAFQLGRTASASPTSTRHWVTLAGNGHSRLAFNYATQRYNSTNGSSDDTGSAISDSFTSAVESVDVSSSSAAVDAATTIITEVPDAPGMVTGAIMNLIEFVHVGAGVPYWEAIVISTIGIRLCLFPVALKTIQGAARMAVMRPEMQKIQDAMRVDPHVDDLKVKSKYEKEMKAIFAKHKVNPFRAILWPLFQFPVFIGLFMALRDMGTHYPGFLTGGTLWFTDLSVADPTMILPVFNSLSFLVMIELGGDGVQVSQQAQFKWIMRGLGAAMIPITMSMPTGLFVYWSINNMLSIGQTVLLKQKALRNYFDIPEPPPAEDTPDLKLRNPFTAINEAIEQERTKNAKAIAEIVDGVEAAHNKKNSSGSTPPGPPAAPAPVSFAMPPRAKKGKKKASDAKKSADGGAKKSTEK